MIVLVAVLSVGVATRPRPAAMPASSAGRNAPGHRICTQAGGTAVQAAGQHRGGLPQLGLGEPSRSVDPCPPVAAPSVGEL